MATAIVNVGAATQSLVSALPGRRIRVLGFTITAGAAAATAVFQSAANAISGIYNLPINGNITEEAPNSRGLFETLPGEALQITGTGGPTQGTVVFTTIPSTPNDSRAVGS